MRGKRTNNFGSHAVEKREQGARAARVEVLRRAVAAGTYYVDLDRLARKIAEDEIMRQGAGGPPPTA